MPNPLERVISRRRMVTSAAVGVGAGVLAVGAPEIARALTAPPRVEIPQTSEVVLPENPLKFTLDGKEYSWLFDNSTNGISPNNPSRIVASIDQSVAGVAGKRWQPQESTFIETQEGTGNSLGVAGWGVESSTKKGYVIVGVRDASGNFRLRVLKLQDITKPDDYTTHELFTSKGLSDGTTKGFWNPTKVVNEGGNHYLEVEVRGSINASNDGKRRLNLDAGGSNIGDWVRVSDATATATITPTKAPTATATPTPGPATRKYRLNLPITDTGGFGSNGSNGSNGSGN